MPAKFKDEIVPVTIPQAPQPMGVINLQDQRRGPREYRPLFDKAGSDGGQCVESTPPPLMVMSAKKAAALGLNRWAASRFRHCTGLDPACGHGGARLHAGARGLEGIRSRLA